MPSDDRDSSDVVAPCSRLKTLTKTRFPLCLHSKTPDVGVRSINKSLSISLINYDLDSHSTTRHLSLSPPQAQPHLFVLVVDVDLFPCGACMFLLSLYSSAPLASFVFVCSLCSLYVPCFLHVRSLYSASMSVSFLPGARRSRSRNRRAARPAPSSDSQLLSWKLLSQRRAAPSSRIPLPARVTGGTWLMGGR